ncbi:MAG: response regulator, partial [Nitrospira sp.]|nr:response regulator [Nitrospira sp.]
MIVLAIEDNRQEMALLREALSSSTNTTILIEHADRLSASLSCLAARRFDAILLDLNLPDSNGLNTLARVKAQAPELPVVILTDLNAEPMAMLAIQNGAQDYVLKGSYDGGAVYRSLRTAVERKRLMTDLEARVAERKQMEEILRISQQRYASLLNSVNGIVWEADPATFCFTFVSTQAEHLLGYPVQQWLNNPSFWPDHIHPEDREQAVAYCTEQTKLGLDHDFEYRML